MVDSTRILGSPSPGGSGTNAVSCQERLTAFDFGRWSAYQLATYTEYNLTFPQADVVYG
jgi:hypothetical protein